MSTSRNVRATRIHSTFAGVFIVAFAVGTEGAWPSAANAAGRASFSATTSTNTGVVMLALVGGLIVLAGIGAVAFTLARRKKHPSPCAEQREALALAEKAVQYWEAVRAHVVTVEAERLKTDEPDNDDASHAKQLAKAVEGLSAALKQRDQCEMDLIHCMASGAPSATPIMPSRTDQPFFIPGADGTSSPESPHSN